MARRLRHTPEGGALFEITCRTIQSRFLLRPSPLLNEIIVGALARAKRLYGVELSAYIFLSNHLHILVWAADSQQLAGFMGYFLSKLAREVVRLTGWRDKVFARRYRAIPVSEEEAAQVERLVYILSNGCKEECRKMSLLSRVAGGACGCLRQTCGKSPGYCRKMSSLSRNFSSCCRKAPRVCRKVATHSRKGSPSCGMSAEVAARCRNVAAIWARDAARSRRLAAVSGEIAAKCRNLAAACVCLATVP